MNKHDLKKGHLLFKDFYFCFIKINIIFTFESTNSLVLPSIHHFLPVKCIFKLFGKIVHCPLNSIYKTFLLNLA